MILRFWVWNEYEVQGVWQLAAAFANWHRAAAWVKAQGEPSRYHIVDTGSERAARETNRRLADMERRVDERIALRRSEIALGRAEGEEAE